MEIDTAATPRPQTGNGADQRALARAGFACNEHALAGLDHDLRLANHGGTIIQCDRQIVEAEHGFVGRFAALDAVDALALLGPLQTVERHHQRCDAPRASVPFRKAWIVIDQPAECSLHDGEGGCCLHHLSERHAAVEKFRCAQENWNHRRDQA